MRLGRASLLALLLAVTSVQVAEAGEASAARGWVTTKQANALLHTQSTPVPGIGMVTFPPGNGSCRAADNGKRVNGKLLHSRFNCSGPGESVDSGQWYEFWFYMDVLKGGQRFRMALLQNPGCLGSNCP